MKPILLSTKQVCAAVCLSESTLRIMVRIEAFPKPVDLGMYRNLWRRKDVERWAKKLHKKYGSLAR